MKDKGDGVGRKSFQTTTLVKEEQEGRINKESQHNSEKILVRPMSSL